MRRAFDVDVLACPRCGGRLRLIATVEDPDAIRAILGALAESEEFVGRAPPPVPALNASHAAATGARAPAIRRRSRRGLFPRVLVPFISWSRAPLPGRTFP